MALAVRLLPQPGSPTIKSPFGVGNPNSLARDVKASRRCRSQAFRPSKPPTSSREPFLVPEFEQPGFLDGLGLLPSDDLRE